MRNAAALALAAGAVGLAASLFVARGSQDASVRLPYEDHGACPFECCTYRTWSVLEHTDVLADRRDGSPVAFRVTAGEEVTGLTGVVITARAGRATVIRQAQLGGRAVVPGQTIAVLRYAGEGTWKFWLDGAVRGDFIPGREACQKALRPEALGCAVQLDEPPDTTWWVRIRNEAGQEGWTRETRHFGRMDRCG